MAIRHIQADYEQDERVVKRVAELIEAALAPEARDETAAQMNHAFDLLIPEVVRSSWRDRPAAIQAIEATYYGLRRLIYQQKRGRKNPTGWLTSVAAYEVISAIDYLEEVTSNRTMVSFYNRRDDFVRALAESANDANIRLAKHSDFYADLGRKVAAAVLEHEPEAVRRDMAPDYMDYEAVERVALEQLVYFIGAGERGPVKIGIATNPQSRLSTLQTAHHEELSILAITTGGRERELAYHAAFGTRRLKGEWFERCPEIEAEIARLGEVA